MPELLIWTGRPMHSELHQAVVGDVVRHEAGRRHWRITGAAGQLVDVEAVGKPAQGEAHRQTFHASELILVKAAA